MPLALGAIFMPPNALGAMKVAALDDFRREAKNTEAAAARFRGDAGFRFRTSRR